MGRTRSKINVKAKSFINPEKYNLIKRYFIVILVTKLSSNKEHIRRDLFLSVVHLSSPHSQCFYLEFIWCTSKLCSLPTNKSSSGEYRLRLDSRHQEEPRWNPSELTLLFQLLNKNRIPLSLFSLERTQLSAGRALDTHSSWRILRPALQPKFMKKQILSGENLLR